MEIRSSSSIVNKELIVDTQSSTVHPKPNDDDLGTDTEKIVFAIKCILLEYNQYVGHCVSILFYFLRGVDGREIVPTRKYPQRVGLELGLQSLFSAAVDVGCYLLMLQYSPADCIPFPAQ